MSRARSQHLSLIRERLPGALLEEGRQHNCPFLLADRANYYRLRVLNHPSSILLEWGLYWVPAVQDELWDLFNRAQYLFWVLVDLPEEAANSPSSGSSSSTELPSGRGSNSLRGLEPRSARSQRGRDGAAIRAAFLAWNKAMEEFWDFLNQPFKVPRAG
jgi:hypothetical protein